MRKHETRGSLLAKVHIAKKDLALDEDTYRAVLKRVTGHESARDCSLPELVRVVAEFRRKGWNPTQTAGPTQGKAKPAKGKAALMGKITALLTEAGRKEEYAEGIARRMYKRDKLDFCAPKELQGIITALSKDAKRHGRRP
ncbi:hypothetical protein NNJEOMEG_02287 [Fundidesulfovibrio magnetotacticus]|uniref:Mu-like prophage protein gp16 n=1 Tax=Fundidesulfovibrio magnetotacticus TaxID=2730080 RepID=A0A6V8LPG3_9BACT|nr:regulatory protein GemA [Fundidesulfovibrio magnetotacticus]GFK94442.1 hypothetical protein NNJEOMEG_02287 [Fundidesulfovibrio magnetotacticus]